MLPSVTYFTIAAGLPTALGPLMKAAPHESQRSRLRFGIYKAELKPNSEAQGESQGAVVMAKPIPDILCPAREAEHAMRMQAERLRIVQDQAPVGICEIDLEGRYLRVNDRFCEITGYPREELLAKRFQDITHPEDVVADYEAYRLQAEKDFPYRIEKRYIHRKGHMVWIELHGYILRDEQGRPLFGVGIVQDISERKRAEAALREADRRKDEFLAMLAHELRNPLAPIRNAVTIMHKLKDADPGLRWVRDVISRQINHLTRLIDDLLDVSRIVQGKLTLKKAPMEVADLIGHAVEASRPFIEERRHTLTVSVPPEPMRVDGDDVRLTQVVANLLDNAAKYTPERGRIWLSAARQDNGVLIRVLDSGIGLSQPLLDRIFDLFVQADRSLDRSQGGLGLGLAIVKRLVEMHGGRIEAYSEGVGKGSEFRVWLPLLE
jgi:PAS domain S-box-containing protein